jgi:hypothetical protein
MPAGKLLKLHFLEILGFDLLFSHELFLIPEPKREFLGVKLILGVRSSFEAPSRCVRNFAILSCCITNRRSSLPESA